MGWGFFGNFFPCRNYFPLRLFFSPPPFAPAWLSRNRIIQDNSIIQSFPGKKTNPHGASAFPGKTWDKQSRSRISPWFIPIFEALMFRFLSRGQFPGIIRNKRDGKFSSWPGLCLLIPGIRARIIREFCAVRGSSASLLPLGEVGELGKPGIIPGAEAWGSWERIPGFLGIYGMLR